MASISMNQTINTKAKSDRMPFLLQVSTLAWRSLLVNFRTPSAILPPLILGGFFLVIYQAQLGNASNFFLRGVSYINFILPLRVTSAEEEQGLDATQHNEKYLQGTLLLDTNGKMEENLALL